MELAEQFLKNKMHFGMDNLKMDKVMDFIER